MLKRKYLAILLMILLFIQSLQNLVFATDISLLDNENIKSEEELISISDDSIFKNDDLNDLDDLSVSEVNIKVSENANHLNDFDWKNLRKITKEYLDNSKEAFNSDGESDSCAKGNELVNARALADYIKQNSSTGYLEIQSSLYVGAEKLFTRISYDQETDILFFEYGENGMYKDTFSFTHAAVVGYYLDTGNNTLIYSNKDGDIYQATNYSLSSYNCTDEVNFTLVSTKRDSILENNINGLTIRAHENWYKVKYYTKYTLKDIGFLRYDPGSRVSQHVKDSVNYWMDYLANSEKKYSTKTNETLTIRKGTTYKGSNYLQFDFEQKYGDCISFNISTDTYDLKYININQYRVAVDFPNLSYSMYNIYDTRNNCYVAIFTPSNYSKLLTELQQTLYAKTDYKLKDFGFSFKEPEEIPIQSLSFEKSKQKMKLRPGDKEVLFYYFSPSNTTQSRKGTWNVSNPSVVSISTQLGRADITALADGITEVTYSVGDVKAVSVIEVETVRPYNTADSNGIYHINLVKGGKLNVNDFNEYLKIYICKNFSKYYPVGYYNYENFDKKIVSYSKGTFKGKKAGTTKCQLGKLDNGYIKKIITVEINVDEPKFERKEEILHVGETFKADFIKTKLTPTWSSSNANVAIVNSNGVITAKQKGKAVITATIEGKKYTKKIIVL